VNDVFQKALREVIEQTPKRERELPDVDAINNEVTALFKN
jgi:hypothetical protein